MGTGCNRTSSKGLQIPRKVGISRYNRDTGTPRMTRHHEAYALENFGRGCLCPGRTDLMIYVRIDVEVPSLAWIPEDNYLLVGRWGMTVGRAIISGSGSIVCNARTSWHGQLVDWGLGIFNRVRYIKTIFCMVISSVS